MDARERDERSRPRRVVYFTDAIAFGGAEQALLILLAGLDRHRWQPVLLYHPESALAPLVARARELGVALAPVPRWNGWGALWRVPGLATRLRQLRPAVFHANLWWPLACRQGIAAAAIARVPAIVATEHLFIDVPWRRSIAVQRLLSGAVGRYLAVSRSVATRLRTDLRIPPGKIRVIPNGVDAAQIARPFDPLLRATLTRGADRPVILTLARLNPQKGLRYLLEAAAQVPEACFVVAGEGDERAALEAGAAALGLDGRFRLLGQRDDVPELLASCDMVVLPSLFEGLPLAVLEGMAAGRPVVATDVDGVGEAISDGETGLLVPPAQPASLARAIRRLLADAELGVRLATAARARVRDHFSAEAMVAGVCETYEQLLTRAGRG